MSFESLQFYDSQNGNRYELRFNEVSKKGIAHGPLNPGIHASSKMIDAEALSDEEAKEKLIQKIEKIESQ